MPKQGPIAAVVVRVAASLAFWLVCERPPAVGTVIGWAGACCKVPGGTLHPGLLSVRRMGEGGQKPLAGRDAFFPFIKLNWVFIVFSVCFNTSGKNKQL